MKKLQILLILFVFISCGENEQLEDQSSWTAHEYFFRTGKILLNGKVENKRLLVVRLDGMVYFDSLSDTPTGGVSAFTGDRLDAKPAIFSDFVLYKGAGEYPAFNNLVLVSSYYSSCTGNPFAKYFRLSELDSVRFGTSDRVNVDFYTRPVGAFNNQGSFLMPVLSTGEKPSLALMHLDYTFSDGPSGKPCAVTTPNSIVHIPMNVDYTISYEFIQSVGSDFFVQFGSFFIITGDGVRKETNLPDHEVISKMFQHQNWLYVLSRDGNLYSSDLTGSHWELFTSGGISSELEMDFFHVEDKLCFYTYSQLFEFDLETLQIIELDNSGLEGHAITSVNQFNDKVWITTLSGLFTKNEERFFERKDKP